MIPRLVEVKVLGDYKLWLRFHDGVSGIIDLTEELWGPMFEPLKNPTVFAQVIVHPELQTATWPNGADLSPEYLYQQAAQSAAAAHRQ
jgi:hypothetical protein